MIKAVVFDWGDTLMRDFDLPGPMYRWARIEWLPGAEWLLKQLSNRFVCCVATSAEHSSADDMRKAFARMGGEKYFHHFFASIDIGFRKPDPRFFTAIIETIDQKPENCLAVGNLYEKDVVPAKKAGMVTIFFNEQKISGFFPEADFVIHDLRSLNDILSKLDNQTQNRH